MGQAKRKQVDEHNARQRRAYAWDKFKRNMKRAPRAIFYSISFPIWFPVLIFILAMKDDDFPWGSNS